MTDNQSKHENLEVGSDGYPFRMPEYSEVAMRIAKRVKHYDNKHYDKEPNIFQETSENGQPGLCNKPVKRWVDSHSRYMQGHCKNKLKPGEDVCHTHARLRDNPPLTPTEKRKKLLADLKDSRNAERYKCQKLEKALRQARYEANMYHILASILSIPIRRGTTDEILES